MGKRLAHSNLHFSQSKLNMLRREVVKKGWFLLLDFSDLKTSKWEMRRKNTCGWYLSWVWCGPHQATPLQGRKNPICGSRMRSTKQGKMIVEISSFQKYIFHMILRTSKFMHRFRGEKFVLSFSLKNAISEF